MKKLEPLPKNYRNRGGHYHQGQRRNHDYLNSLNVLNYESYYTLHIHNKNTKTYKESDEKFLRDVYKIVKVRSKSLMNILDINNSVLTDLQCDELHYIANLHSKANIINENTKNPLNKVHPEDRCYCGCERARGYRISIFADDQDLNVLGPGILLLFLLIKSMVFIMLGPLLIYGIFALVTNLIGHYAYPNEICSYNMYCVFKTNSSDYNKDVYGNLRTVQQWLGLAFCVVWIFLIRFLKYLGKLKNAIVDSKLKSSSDNAIKIENLPRNSYQEKYLIDYLYGWWEKMTLYKKASYLANAYKINRQYEYNNIKDAVNPFKIKSIQIVYNMEFSRQMVDQIFFYAAQLDALLYYDGNGNRNIVNRVDYYRKIKEKLKQTYELLLDLRKKFLNDPYFRKGLATTCCIIEFREQKMRKFILDNCGKYKIGLIKEIQTFIKKVLCIESREIIFKGKVLKLERAPEPSDILWTNCYKTPSMIRIIGLYFLTFLIMLVSFGILTGLNYAQYDFKKNPYANDMVQTVLNLVMSLAMNIINKILWFSLYYFLDEEYNHTLTYKIISQMNKVIILTSLNIIAFPIITNYIVLKGNFLYGNDGLSGFAFDYQISCVIQALTKILDPMMIIKKIVIAIKWIRYHLIRFMCKNFDELPPKKGCQPLNKFYEGEYFDVAEHYVFLTAAILQSAFFAHLQPMVLFIVVVVIAIFYITSRMKLLYICKIPYMTDYLVFYTAISFLGWVPIFYGTGTIVISYLQHRDREYYPFHFIAGAICIGCGIIALMNPKDFLNKIVKKIISCLDCIDLYEILGDFGDEDAYAYSYFSMGYSSYYSTYKNYYEYGTTNRIYSYYDNSNSLSLFGFYAFLKGYYPKTISHELKRFCESFFPKIANFDQLYVKNVLTQLAVGVKTNGGLLGGILGQGNQPMSSNINTNTNKDYNTQKEQKNDFLKLFSNNVVSNDEKYKGKTDEMIEMYSSKILKTNMNDTYKDKKDSYNDESVKYDKKESSKLYDSESAEQTFNFLLSKNDKNSKEYIQ